jgi:hypothetical protein
MKVRKPKGKIIEHEDDWLKQPHRKTQVLKRQNHKNRKQKDGDNALAGQVMARANKNIYGHRW